MYSSKDPSRCTHHSFLQNSSGRTHLKIRHAVRSVFSPSPLKKIACRQQHLNSGSCQGLRGKISGVGFCGMLAKSQCFLRDFVLHPQPLDLKMLQTSGPLSMRSQCPHSRRDKTTASTARLAISRSTPQPQTWTSAFSLWLQSQHPQTRRCSSAAVDAGTSKSVSDCSSSNE